MMTQPQNNIKNKQEEIVIKKNEHSSEPSSEMKVQQTQNDEKMNVVKSVVRNVVREDDDWDWGARGWCRTHCLMGKKMTNSSKKWGKKKDGLNG